MPPALGAQRLSHWTAKEVPGEFHGLYTSPWGRKESDTTELLSYLLLLLA